MRERGTGFLKRLGRALAPAAACGLMASELPAQGPYGPYMGSPAAYQPYYPPNAGYPGVVPAGGNPYAPQYMPLPEPGPQQLAPLSSPVPIGISCLASPHRPEDLLAGNMIGDALGTFGNMSITATNVTTGEAVNALFDIPMSGRVPKIAENNSPIPRDRVYFAYNHFHNAYAFQSTVTPPVDSDPPLSPQTRNRTLNQNRFTVGIEKKLFFDDISLELRVPLVTQVDFNAASVVDPTQTAASIATNDPTGNVALNFKQVLLDYYSDDVSGLLTWGLGLTFPTGDGAAAQIFDTRVVMDDSALHFSPYLAFLITEANGLFFQGFFQFDFTNDHIDIYDTVEGKVQGFRPPSYGYVDLGVGYWLFHNPSRRWLIGLAPMFEFHYSGQMRSVDSPSFSSTSSTLNQLVTFNTPNFRRNVYNLTAGVNAIITPWLNMRTAGVFPYKGTPFREFDAEYVFQMDLLW